MTLHKPPSAASNFRWPQPIGSPVLDSLRPVIEHSRDVKTNLPKLIEVAQWMAYEELPVPQYSIPFAADSGNASQAIDFTLVAIPVIDGDEQPIGVVAVDDVIELLLPEEWRRRAGAARG